MAKTSHIQVPVESEDKYYQSVQSMDRFIIPRIRTKTALLSRNKKLLIANRSLLPQCSALWNNFTDEQKQAWKDVDNHSQQHGYRTFLADQVQRIKLDLAGVATPNQYHQNMAGQLLVTAPADEIKIAQLHPSSYWVYQRVVGKDNMFEPVEVTESFVLPLKITISYKSDLTSTGEGSFVRFYASVRHLYQGQNLNHDLIINIPLQSHWFKEETTISELIGKAISYNLYIHLYNVTGTLLIDNVKAEHSGSNWTIDSFCNKIEQTFSRGFYQISQPWSPIILPTGASYQSIYTEDEIYTASLYGLRYYGINIYGEEE